MSSDQSVSRAGAGAPISRRAAFRAGVTAAGVAAAGAVLSACSSGATAAGTTKAAAATIKLLWRPWYNFTGATSKTGEALLMEGIKPWLTQNKGVEVSITYMGYQQATVAAMLAGVGPDIFADWVLPLYLGQNLLLPISKYVQQDNVDLTIFPSRDLQVFTQSGSLWALPSYLHLQAPTVNLGILDELALTYPDASWTYEQWGQLMQQTAKKSSNPSKNRMGGWFYWSGYDSWGGVPAPYYLQGFGGSYVDPNDNTKCNLSASGSEACLSWIFGLMKDGVAGTGSANFQTGNQAITYMDTAGGLIGAAQSWGGLKWNIFDEFKWPVNQTAYAASDFYAINAATKNADVAWSFMKYLVIEQDWQKWMVHLAMNGPNQKTLYPFWETTVKQVAAPLAKIDLSVFTRQMDNNAPVFGGLLKYQDQRAGQTISSTCAPAIQNPQLVPQVCSSATKLVNTIETSGAKLQNTANALQKLFPSSNNQPIAAVTPGI